MNKAPFLNIHPGLDSFIIQANNQLQAYIFVQHRMKIDFTKCFVLSAAAIFINLWALFLANFYYYWLDIVLVCITVFLSAIIFFFVYNIFKKAFI